jgi:hypothetical protein
MGDKRMSIPVVEIEHKVLPQSTFVSMFVARIKKEHISFECAPDCPACAVEANNKAWAKWVASNQKGSIILSETTPFTGHYVAVVHFPASDWEQIKKLAEEKVDG